MVDSLKIIDAVQLARHDLVIDEHYRMVFGGFDIAIRASNGDKQITALASVAPSILLATTLILHTAKTLEVMHENKKND